MGMHICSDHFLDPTQTVDSLVLYDPPQLGGVL